MILSTDTKALQLILNIRHFLDKITGLCLAQDYVTPLIQGTAATLIFSTMLFDFPYLRKQNSKYTRLELPKNILIQAAAVGLLQAVQQLIEFGYPADESGKGITTLYNASARGFPDICALLIKASVPVDTKRGHWGCALQAA